eukprot:gene14795-17489_t
MDRITGLLYKTLFKRNSTFIATAIVGAFVFESTVHSTVDCFFEKANTGKLWKDVYAERVAKGISQ